MDLEADTFIGRDAYNNTYFIKDFGFYKEGKEGNFVFNDFLLGPISSVDILNPLNIILYYHDVNTVIFLDNSLTEIERIDFNLLPKYINTETVTNAGNNELWIFNADSQQIELFNHRSLNKTITTQPLDGEIQWQSSNFNICYILTNRSIHAFNRYGSLLSSFKNDGFEKLYFSDKNLIVLKENKLFFVFENSVHPIKLPLPEIVIKDLQIKEDLLYIYDGKKMYSFSITQPK